MTDASDQLHAIPTGILIVPTAVLENSVSNEGRIMVLIIKDDRIRSIEVKLDMIQCCDPWLEFLQHSVISLSLGLKRVVFSSRLD